MTGGADSSAGEGSGCCSSGSWPSEGSAFAFAMAEAAAVELGETTQQTPAHEEDGEQEEDVDEEAGFLPVAGAVVARGIQSAAEPSHDTRKVGLPATSRQKTRRLYLADFCVEVLRMGEKCDFATLIPTTDELGRMRYSASCTLHGGTSRTITLHHPRTAPSTNRFFHRFGSDRFLFLELPVDTFNPTLGLEAFQLCGRRFAYLTHKPKLFRRLAGDKLNELEALECTEKPRKGVMAVFFAEEGPGLEPTRVQHVRDWHVPPSIGQHMALAEYVDTFGLGFSSCTRTVQLAPSDICIVEDLRGVENDSSQRPVLTRGCGVISGALMDEIEGMLGFHSRQLSALRVRVGLAKGTLVRRDALEGRKIWLTKSQLQYEYEAGSGYFLVCEPCQRTLEIKEVVESQGQPRPAHLNYQVVSVLQTCGMSPATLVGMERRFSEEAISKGASCMEQVLQGDFLPRAEVATHRHATSLGRKVWGMTAAGMDPTQDAHFFSLLKELLAAKLGNLRKRCAIPCASSWRLKVVPDFSRRLKPNTMSAWVPGHGFLSGPQVVLRYPCLRPEDIAIFKAVDTLHNNVDVAYQNLAVLPAESSMTEAALDGLNGDSRGATYGGRDVFVIGLPEIVEAVQTAQKMVLSKYQRKAEAEAISKKFFTPRIVRKLEEVAPGAKSHTLQGLADLEEALASLCDEAVRDAIVTERLNFLWLRHADRDLATVGKFQQNTSECATILELALAGPWLGLQTQMLALADLEDAPMPKWAASRWKLQQWGAVSSFTTLGQLHERPDPQAWVENAFQGPKAGTYPEGCQLAAVADNHVGASMLKKVGAIQVWYAAVAIWRNLYSPGSRMAVEQARKRWTSEIDAAGYSREAFALMVYAEFKGDASCWTLCFEELCAAFSRSCGMLPTVATPFPVVANQLLVATAPVEQDHGGLPMNVTAASPKSSTLALADRAAKMTESLKPSVQKHETLTTPKKLKMLMDVGSTPPESSPPKKARVGVDTFDAKEDVNLTCYEGRNVVYSNQEDVVPVSSDAIVPFEGLNNIADSIAQPEADPLDEAAEIKDRELAKLQELLALPMSSTPAPATPPMVRAEELPKLCSDDKLGGEHSGDGLWTVPKTFVRFAVDDLHYIHSEISDHFQDGRPVSQLVRHLEMGLVNPLAVPSLLLDVVEFDGKFWALHNRRLYALREYQRLLRMKSTDTNHTVEVNTQVMSTSHPQVMEHFLRHFSTRCSGHFVTLRPRGRS